MGGNTRALAQSSDRLKGKLPEFVTAESRKVSTNVVPSVKASVRAPGMGLGPDQSQHVIDFHHSRIETKSSAGSMQNCRSVKLGNYQKTLHLINNPVALMGSFQKKSTTSHQEHKPGVRTAFREQPPPGKPGFVQA